MTWHFCSVMTQHCCSLMTRHWCTLMTQHCCSLMSGQYCGVMTSLIIWYYNSLITIRNCNDLMMKWNKILVLIPKSQSVSLYSTSKIQPCSYVPVQLSTVVLKLLDINKENHGFPKMCSTTTLLEMTNILKTGHKSFVIISILTLITSHNEYFHLSYYQIMSI